jgi:hypothetical protein
MRQIFLLCIICAAAFNSHAQQKDCDSLLHEPVLFFNDGSVRDRAQVYRQLLPLIGCGIDSTDAELLFRGALYEQFMGKLARTQDVNNLYFKNVLIVADTMTNNEKYKDLKDFKVKTDILASRIASWENWHEDKELFEELGASYAVMMKVEQFLEEQPEPKLTYLELLRNIKDQ